METRDAAGMTAWFCVKPSNGKPLFAIARWTPAWRLPEFNTLVALAVISGMAFAFASIADEMAEGETRAFDDAILLALRDPRDLAKPIGPWWLETAMVDVTSLGGAATLTLLTAFVVVFLLIAERRGSAALVAASVAGGTVLSALLKNAFARPRPELVDHLVNVNSLSFPSGHAMLSAATYLTLGALLARTETRRVVRGYIFGVAVFLTVIIGISRVFLGVHYPTDVLAGWCLGASWALACWTAARWLRPKDNETDAA